MSYDFDLMEVSPGVDIAQLLESREDAIVKEMKAGVYPVVTGEQKAFMRRLATSLKEFDPMLELMEGLYESFELHHSEDDAGITIGIYRDSASITVPYWHRGEKAKAILKRIWRYLEFVQRQTGFGVYDHQVGRVLDLNSEEDFSDVLTIYDGTMGMIDKTIRGSPPPTEP